MRSTIRISIALLLITVLGEQCSTQKSVDLVIPPCFPTAIATTSTGVSSTIVYTYNSGNLVTATKTTTTAAGQAAITDVAYTYDGEGNIITASESIGTGSIGTRSCTYNTNKNLAEETHTTGGILESRVTYHYNSTQQLISVDYTLFAGAGSSTSTSTYTYPTPVGRNPTTITSSSGSTTTYTYDTKPNPLKVLFVSTQPDNNITKVTITAGGSATNITTYTYQYDNNGFPTARTGSNGETKAYTYFCK